VRRIHADCDCVVVHSGRNEMPDDRRHDNNYCWVLCGPLNDGRSGGTRNLNDDPSHLCLRVPRAQNMVESAWGAVPGLLPVRFPRQLAEPAVPVSRQRALHGVRRSGVVGQCPEVGDLAAPVSVPGDRDRCDVEQFDPVHRRPAPPAVAAGEVTADVVSLPAP
jgi:hypothetical protein